MSACVCVQSNLSELAEAHDKLIGRILLEEEDMIQAHRSHIDCLVELIKDVHTHTQCTRTHTVHTHKQCTHTHTRCTWMFGPWVCLYFKSLPRARV